MTSRPCGHAHSLHDLGSRAAVACAFALGLTGVAWAAPTPPGAIAIEADQGIEWQRGTRLVIARGNAKAVRDDTEVRAQVLTAHYRDAPDGSAQVWKVDAEGAVRLTSPGQTAFGERGTYNVDTGALVLTGGQVGVTTADSKITAQKQLSYDAKTKTLVATGNAVAVDGERTVYGDVITVHLREDAAGKTAPTRMEADGHVRVVTAQDDIRADRGTFDVERDVATVDGSVRIVRGANQLEGCRGEMNMRTGVSKLSACPGGQAGGSRVQGLIIPKPKTAP